MQVTWAEHVLDYANDPAGIDEMFKEIHQYADRCNLLLGHLVVDGEEVYNDYYHYLVDRIGIVASIEVKFRTPKQMLDDLLLSTEHYLTQAMPAIKSLADDFYRSISNETWGRFAHLAEGLQSISLLVQSMCQNKEHYPDWDSYYQLYSSIEQEFVHLDEAVRGNDAVLIGDILTYEFIPALETLHGLLQQTIDCGVKRDDLN